MAEMGENCLCWPTCSCRLDMTVEETFSATLEIEEWAGNDDPKSREKEALAMIRHLIDAGPNLVSVPRSAEWKANAEEFLERRKVRLLEPEQLTLGGTA